MWDGFVEVIRAAIFAVAHACGGSIGGSVALVSFGVRIAMIPLAIRVARRARERQALLEGLKPDLARLQRRYEKDPMRLATETMALHRKHGVRLFDAWSLTALAIQAPLLSGLFAAVRAGLGAGRRFLWVADLARPDAWLALVATALVAGSMAMAPAPSADAAAAMKLSALIAAATTLVVLLSSSGAVVVSAAAGAVGGMVQGWVGRHAVSSGPNHVR